MRPGTRSRNGSSPLARGLPGLHPPAQEGGGIIPARAGFTVKHGQAVENKRDHPRSRGVYASVISSPTAGIGSSPLARGLRAHCGVGRFARGIIPARAGFTPRRRRLRSSVRDHPRSRGVYGDTGTGKTQLLGSSPLARGLQRRIHRLARPRWIIPARAGFTEGGRNPKTYF